ncbi:putative Tic20 family protein [Pseudarthrobacter siccitolerans]|uniref:Tic20 family protein n=1 Tax=Pseudarthrobacter siccitolerans TaxID=861266 RepID=A0ABU0PG30_9MICC|nr:putative Tic20 family protein [Pseudarthrobacter siccitolerans]MDQ0690851.1 putative Tic20 family protein [Arthrobacter sp. W4I7]
MAGPQQIPAFLVSTIALSKEQTVAENARDHRDSQGGQGRSEYHGVPANALPLTASEDRQWATLSHFGGILGCVPALLIFLIFRDRGPFTAQESKEALNFSLPPTIAAVVANILVFVPVVGNIFAVLATLIWIALTCFSVAAGIHVNRGQPHRYQYNLRWIK